MDDRLRVPVLELGSVLQKLQARVREQDSGQQGLEPVGGDDVRGRGGARRGRRGARGGRGAAAAAAAGGVAAGAASAPSPAPPAALPPQYVEHPRLRARGQAPVRLNPPPERALGHRGPAGPGGHEPGEQRVGEHRRQVEDVSHEVLECGDGEATYVFLFLFCFV